MQLRFGRRVVPPSDPVPRPGSRRPGLADRVSQTAIGVVIELNWKSTGFNRDLEIAPTLGWLVASSITRHPDAALLPLIFALVVARRFLTLSDLPRHGPASHEIA